MQFPMLTTDPIARARNIVDRLEAKASRLSSGFESARAKHATAVIDAEESGAPGASGDKTRRAMSRAADELADAELALANARARLSQEIEKAARDKELAAWARCRSIAAEQASVARELESAAEVLGAGFERLAALTAEFHGPFRSETLRSKARWRAWVRAVWLPHC